MSATKEIPAAAVGVFGTALNASVGNYKGVMLCNRPNELGLAKKVS